MLRGLLVINDISIQRVSNAGKEMLNNAHSHTTVNNKVLAGSEAIFQSG